MSHGLRIRRPRGGYLVGGLALLLMASVPALGQSTASPSGLPGPSAAPAFDPKAVRITLEPFAKGLFSPVFITGDGSGSGLLYVVEQPGRILAFDSDGTRHATPFLNISDRLVAGDERGLLGLAFHPDYAANGRFFVDYTRRPDGATVISEFRAVDGVAAADSERVLLTIAQPFENHNGGMIAFDAEGMLLIGMGDGGDAGDPLRYGQNRDALLGKMLRIDVDGVQPYGIPADNPFPSDARTRPEIWTVGMRNPWRFSVDSLTGDLFIGDVGQDRWEEVDVVPAGTSGQDFGWNITEGPDCFVVAKCDRTGLSGPVASLGHGIADCAIIGGYVYRGTRYPELVGGYVFGDDCSNKIRVLSASQAVSSGLAKPVDVGQLDSGNLAAFGQGDDGELYAVDLSGGILRVVATAPD